jgi:hypothetical protein
MDTRDISAIKDINTLESGHYRQTQMSQSSGPPWRPVNSVPLGFVGRKKIWIQSIFIKKLFKTQNSAKNEQK